MSEADARAIIVAALRSGSAAEQIRGIDAAAQVCEAVGLTPGQAGVLVCEIADELGVDMRPLALRAQTQVRSLKGAQ